MMRVLVFLFGIVSYLIGVVGLVCIIAALTGFLAFGFLWQEETHSFNPWLWNLSLVALWGFIHSLTARPSYKKWLTKFIPVASERATYVLISGITSVVLIGYWREIPGVLWSIETSSLIFVIWALVAVAWGFLLASTFAINHFDLFGLRQVYYHLKAQPCPPLKFTERLMYKYVRHPIQTGVLVGVWIAPTMTLTHLALSIGFTIYIFVGLWFEERDLIAEHGDSYLDYQKRVGGVMPRVF